jgi:hypothetical protein
MLRSQRLIGQYLDFGSGSVPSRRAFRIKGRSIVRAFEVEHTTAIYSGILRMADLLALQPNMDIKMHIVAPTARREEVFSVIRRPVFSLLEGRPLAERCTLLTYESVREIAGLQHLEHLQDSVLEEYEEEADEHGWRVPSVGVASHLASVRNASSWARS